MWFFVICIRAALFKTVLSYLRFFLTILFSLKETSYFHFTKNYF
jgi:hypothetical protein